jgi:beta-lactamase superfamily II metal-dependent hydrolase
VGSGAILVMKIKKIIFPTIVVALASLLLNNYWSDFRSLFVVNRNTDKLIVRFLDVGQGDSIYIRTTEKQDILIDGGPDERVIGELGRAMPFLDDEIDAVILTHPHADHVVGLVEVLKRYKVGAVYYTGASHTSSVFFEFLNLIKQKEIPFHITKAGDQIPLLGAEMLKILWPQKSLANEKNVDLNDGSIVSQLIFGKTSFLFMGDAGEKVEAELLSNVKLLKSDLIKIGHHGSKTASSEKFLKVVAPEYAVILCGKNNDFGFPAPRILKRLLRLGVQVFRTDLDEQITAISDGVTLELEKMP